MPLSQEERERIREEEELRMETRRRFLREEFGHGGPGGWGCRGGWHWLKVVLAVAAVFLLFHLAFWGFRGRRGGWYGEACGPRMHPRGYWGQMMPPAQGPQGMPDRPQGGPRK